MLHPFRIANTPLSQLVEPMHFLFGLIRIYSVISLSIVWDIAFDEPNAY